MAVECLEEIPGSRILGDSFYADGQLRPCLPVAVAKYLRRITQGDSADGLARPGAAGSGI